MADRGIPEKFEVCPADEKILGIGRDFDQWYAQLKTQSPCNKNTCTLSCRTRNTGAQVCGPTSRRWNSIGCHPNNQTAIFPTVSHGFAAHIELLRRYCSERGRCTIGTVVAQWAEGARAGDRSPYAAFVSKNAGIPVNQVYNPNDIDLMARLAMSMACFEAGALPYTAAELKQGVVMANGGQKVAVPANVGQLLNESLAGGYTANPSYSPNSHPGSWTYPPSSVGGSNYIPPRPPQNPLPLISNPSNVYQTNAFSTQQQPADSTGVASNVVFPPASSIIAQPSTVTRGNSVIVSWTSVGMSSASPCTVATDISRLLAQDNEGTRIVPASSTSTNILTFFLQCQSSTGVVQQSASVTLR